MRKDHYPFVLFLTAFRLCESNWKLTTEWVWTWMNLFFKQKKQSKGELLHTFQLFFRFYLSQMIGNQLYQ